ncbi:hypothetical protein Salat_0119800 [Sesamum alatum]|uniref:Uncharacterized protein n=1 Tax=Sesamum alatum TaxID=300844 RepID=A0AAE1YXK1_9LAMI|nr:hypothetical protein Salat_0119800 [Sesamum alatum]
MGGLEWGEAEAKQVVGWDCRGRVVPPWMNYGGEPIKCQRWWSEMGGAEELECKERRRGEDLRWVLWWLELDERESSDDGGWWRRTGRKEKSVGGRWDLLMARGHAWGVRHSTVDSGIRRRGAQIFGSFQAEQGGAVVVALGDSSVATRQTVMVGQVLPRQLATACGTDKGWRFRQSRDESSDSLGLAFGPSPELGPKCGRSVAARKLGPLPFEPTLALSDEEVFGMTNLGPRSFEPTQTQPTFNLQFPLPEVALSRDSSSRRRSTDNSSSLSPVSGNPAALGPASSLSPAVSSVPSSPA